MLVAPSGNLSDINARYRNAANKPHSSLNIVHECGSFFYQLAIVEKGFKKGLITYNQGLLIYQRERGSQVNPRKPNFTNQITWIGYRLYKFYKNSFWDTFRSRTRSARLNESLFFVVIVARTFTTHRTSFSPTFNHVEPA